MGSPWGYMPGLKQRGCPQLWEPKASVPLAGAGMPHPIAGSKHQPPPSLPGTVPAPPGARSASGPTSQSIEGSVGLLLCQEELQEPMPWGQHRETESQLSKAAPSRGGCEHSAAGCALTWAPAVACSRSAQNHTVQSWPLVLIHRSWAAVNPIAPRLSSVGQEESLLPNHLA